MNSLLMTLLALAQGQAAEGTAPSAPATTAATAAAADAARYSNWWVVAFILFFVVASILITVWTSRSTKSTNDFYVASKGVPWIQMGIAMVGSYLSAASFLGCAGDIGVFGIDSIWLSIGFFGGYMALLMLIAGPLRNVGSFTVAGALCRRFPSSGLKLAVMLCTVIISTFYLVPQMLGAGLLFEMMMGWNFLMVTIGLGVLMSVYIIFGGMKSTLYNQVLQALFLWAAMVVLVVIAFFTIGDGSVGKVMDTARTVVPPDAISDALVVEFKKDPAAARLVYPQAISEAEAKVKPSDDAQADAAARLKAAQAAYVKAAYQEIAAQVKDKPAKEAILLVRERLPKADNGLTIGVKSDNWLAMLSTVIALVFGTAGLPHILIMFFTVPSASAAKKSVTLCIVALGIFYICAITLGFLLFPSVYADLVNWVSQGSIGVGRAKNMAVLNISEMVGGKLLMAIGAAGAVAAILSTAAGLMITVAGSISNDLYKAYINPQATEKQELTIARITTLTMSAIAVALAVLLKDQNIAWLVMLAFGIAASAIFPAMIGTLWWRGATRQGVIASILSGLAVSVVFIYMLLTKHDMFLGLPTSGGPGVFGVTVGTIVLILVSLITRDHGPNVEQFMAQAHKPDVD